MDDFTNKSDQSKLTLYGAELCGAYPVEDLYTTAELEDMEIQNMPLRLLCVNRNQNPLTFFFYERYYVYQIQVTEAAKAPDLLAQLTDDKRDFIKWVTANPAKLIRQTGVSRRIE